MQIWRTGEVRRAAAKQRGEGAAPHTPLLLCCRLSPSACSLRWISACSRSGWKRSQQQRLSEIKTTPSIFLSNLERGGMTSSGFQFMRENLKEHDSSALAEFWPFLLFLSAGFPAPLLRLGAFLVLNKWVISATLYLSHLSDPE